MEDIDLGKHISATGLTWIIAARPEHEKVENIGE